MSRGKDSLDSDTTDVLLWGMSRMPIRRRRGRPQPDLRHALELLASSRDGYTEAIMIAHGFTVPQMVELVRAGLATAHTRRVIVARRTVEVAYFEDH
jgi:hypothetical protein